MKKTAIFIIVLLSFGILSTCVFAQDSQNNPENQNSQENKDKEEISKIAVGMINDYIYGDINAIMAKCSPNYRSMQDDGTVIDYAKLRSSIENDIKEMRKFVNLNCTNADIYNFELKDGDAKVELEFECKAFDLDQSKDVSKKIQKRMFLKKEDGAWRVIEFGKAKKS